MALEKVISGGQTGVDRAALDAAIECNVPHGGWCPKGRIAHDGPIPLRYNLQETTSKAYPPRTALNIRDADGTLILHDGSFSRGTRLTMRLAKDKPNLVIRFDEWLMLAKICDWILAYDIRVLNVAGPSEKESNVIYKKARYILTQVFNRVKRKEII